MGWAGSGKRVCGVCRARHCALPYGLAWWVAGCVPCFWAGCGMGYVGVDGGYRHLGAATPWGEKSGHPVTAGALSAVRPAPPHQLAHEHVLHVLLLLLVAQGAMLMPPPPPPPPCTTVLAFAVLFTHVAITVCDHMPGPRAYSSPAVHEGGCCLVQCVLAGGEVAMRLGLHACQVGVGWFRVGDAGCGRGAGTVLPCPRQ